MGSTACFTSERIANYAICQLSQHSSMPSSLRNLYNNNPNYDPKAAFYQLLTSHVAGGIVSGAFIGRAFQKRPIYGMLFFTPIMVGVAYVEHKIDEYRRHRWQEFLKEVGEDDDDDKSHHHDHENRNMLRNHDIKNASSSSL